MEQQYIKVNLNTTPSISRIEVLYNQSKVINVYINNTSQEWRKSLFRDFTHITKNNLISHFVYANDVQDSTAKLFQSACELNNKYYRLQTTNAIFSNAAVLPTVLDSDLIPVRFIPDETAHREIILSADAKYEDASSIINQLNTNQPMANSSISGLPRRKNNLSQETIKLLAKTIKNTVTINKIAHPNFTNKSRANYTKIRNFIHNLTRQWLRQNEIEKFADEYNQL